jgi:hypothetical protein
MACHFGSNWSNGYGLRRSSMVQPRMDTNEYEFTKNLFTLITFRYSALSVWING